MSDKVTLTTDSWLQLLQNLSQNLKTSLTSTRITTLNELLRLLNLHLIPSTDLPTVAIQLLNTYDLYLDEDSRRHVVSVLIALLTSKPDFLPNFVKFIYDRAKITKAIAITDLQTLLLWTNEFAVFASNNSLVSDELVLSQAILAEKILNDTFQTDESNFNHKKHRTRLFNSTIATIRLTLATCFVADDLLVSRYIDVLVGAGSGSSVSASSSITLLGILRSAVEFVSPIKPSLINLVDTNKILAFFLEQVLLSKSPISKSSIKVFGLFTRTITTENFISQVLPSLEKANLRSPEAIFQLLPEFYASLDKDICQLTDFFSTSKLPLQFISAFKATKEQTRIGALSCFQNLLTHLAGDSKTVDLILSSVKGVSNVDQKLIFASAIRLIPVDTTTSTSIVTVLTPLVAKDQNETSLSGFASAYIFHLIGLLSSNEDVDLKTLIGGLSDKKINLRRIWSTELGNSLFDIGHSHSPKLIAAVEEIYPILVKATGEAISSPLPTVSNKGISTAFVTLAIGKLAKLWGSQLLTSMFSQLLPQVVNPVDEADGDNKLFLLTSQKIFTKLSTDEEIVWFCRALDAVPEYEQSNPNLGRAWIHTALSNVSSHIRKLSLGLLANHNPHSIIDAMYSSLKKGEFSERDVNLLAPIVSVVSRKQDEQIARKLLVVANYVPIKDGWVGLCQRSEVDPGKITAENADNIIDEVLSIETISPLSQAAIKAASLVAFIQPDIIAPKLTSFVEQSTDPKCLTFDPTSIKIFLAEEGELVINPVKTKTLNDKNAKDYETRKWEESVKKELESKGKLQKKYTKDEQLLIDQQLKKESQIRADISKVVEKANRAILVVNGLLNDVERVDNGQKYWYPTSLKAILQCANKFTTLLGEKPYETFIKLSDVLTTRLGNLRKFVGSAILRLNNVPLPSDLTQEPLVDLLSRILFRVKFLSDQTPLDSLSLSYFLPLLQKVLEIGKKAVLSKKTKKVTSEFEEEDPQEEQLLLAIEILGSHAEIFEDANIPRTFVLKELLSLMQLPSKAKIAKETFSSIAQYISDSISETDLQVLLDTLVQPDVYIRTAVLESFDAEFTFNGGSICELFIATFDKDPQCQQLSLDIWEEGGFTKPSFSELLQFANNKDNGLRLSIAESLADIASSTGDIAPLYEHYREMEKAPSKVYDEYGLEVKSEQPQDRWENRSTVALALNEIVPKDVKELVTFLIQDPAALADQKDEVRDELQEAGLTTINRRGNEFMEELIPIFESCLSSKSSGKTQDKVRESTIILYGALARHLPASDPRLLTILDRLLLTLDTPAEGVQQSISRCISPLVQKVDPSPYFAQLLVKIFEGKSLAVRRGAAYGIAGFVKGAGIKSLSDYDIIRELTDVADDKKSPQKREGVALAFESLSQALGKYFEPYIIESLPLLLRQLGDLAPEVRSATDKAAKEIMRHTTGFGVKQLIPVAISNLDEIAWRSKKGSVELLGSMAYLDPTQLSASLLTIVPEIVGVLNDTHKEVRKAADASLKRFGEVIRNPEIQEIVPVLLQAIGDPTKYTDEALDKLIKTQFVHYIDGPSLALIIHVIHRGMKDRSAGTKKKACQIVGNMAFLVDAKDLAPYLEELEQELEIAMVDPVPATRSTAARAIGLLVEKLGESLFPDLIPRLMFTLQDESRAGDRLGSAQALAEVISGLGITRLEDLLPEILKQAQSSRSHIRAGYMPMLLFLPVCFGSQFAPYLASVISPILNGLADTDEEIRDTSLRAGRLIVQNYAKKAVDLLLPELENGMSDEEYRIRLSSVQLTGDLLFQVTGISGKTELDEEDASGSQVSRALIDALGQERRDRILALLFICRSDVSGLVRAASVDIWKALVANSPKTIKEVLPTLTNIIVRKLASPDDTQRTIAAQTLGEMVRRVGANALSQLLPTLEESLQNSDTDAKQGICIALTELVHNSSRDAVLQYQEVFIRTARIALSDPADDVRQAAAQTFEVLQETLGKSVVDAIIPHLLQELQTGDDVEKENALMALKDIMSTKADVVFPILLPNLLLPPMDGFKASALASLSAVAGPALIRKLPLVINTLVDSLMDASSTDEEKDTISTSFDEVLVSVDDEGLHILMQTLLGLVKHEDARKRAVIYERLGPFFSNTTLDYLIYLQDMISQFVMSLGDRQPEVVKGTFEALSALTKKQTKETLEKLVRPTREALLITGVRGEDLAGFNLPRGAGCILPIFLQGLMYGNSDQKELSAQGIADVISKTNAANLKPFATTITGPLIRVIGEKVNSDIKTAILDALTLLLGKIPAFLRPFIPQLQRTFVRSLLDSSNERLRSGAVVALGTLITHQPRVDPLVTELVTSAKAATEQGVKTAVLKGILEVISKAGKQMSEALKSLVLGLVEAEITRVSEKSAVSYARLVGTLAQCLLEDEATNILRDKILASEDSKFAILSINAFLKEAPYHVFNTGLLQEVARFVESKAQDTLPYVSDNATIAIGKILLLNGKHESPVSSQKQASEQAFNVPEGIVETFAHILAKNMLSPESGSPETRRLSQVVVRTVSRVQYELFKPFWDFLAPSVFTCVRDPIIPIRLAAEKCFLSLFNMVNDEKLKDFLGWFDGKETFRNEVGTEIVARSIGDYTKRVGARLASVERERVEAGGDEETLYSDRIEDETEVWAVGGVDLKK